MLARIFALVAVVALASAHNDKGGACTIKTTKPPKPTPTTSSTSDDCSTRTVCIDHVNECGIKCVPDCKPWPTFPKPPCPSTTMTTKPPKTTPTPTSTEDNCSTRTICLDYVNECGIWYGGCVPDCKPWPTFSKPPCPSTTSAPVTTTAPSTEDNCSTRTVCIDKVNECGMMYGGCVPDCKPWPTFEKPPCPSTTTLVTSRATKGRV